MSAMSNESNFNSRRNFLYKTSLASLSVLCLGKSAWAANSFVFGDDKPNSIFSGVQIGAITYSWRSLPNSPEQIVQYCIDCNINAIELMGDAIEDYAGKPINTVKMPPRVPGQPMQLSDELKKSIAAYQASVAEWRANVPMDKFIAIRKMFKKAGVRIYAFKPDSLSAKNTDAEVEYALRAAKALGAISVTLELPNNDIQTQRLGDFGAKHNIYIGYHAHTQATDTAWDTALSQSPYNSMNLDCGHYIAVGGANTPETLLALIEAKHERITSMHIKDRLNKQNGAKNVVWGKGNTPLKEILHLLKNKHYKIPATIELEYDIPEGSNPITETKNCVAFAKQILA